MKICLVTFDFPPFSIGGIGTLVYDLASYLSKEGVQVHVLAAGERDEEELVNGLFKVTRLKVSLYSRVTKIPTFQYRVWRWLGPNNMAFDVIHFQESAGFLYLLLNAFGSQNKNTVEQFHHSHVAEFMIHLKFFSKAPKESLPYLSMPLKIFQEYISLKLAKRVITVSNHSRSTLFSWNINPEKVTVIANALNESYFEEGGQKQKQNNLLTFLYVGRLVPRKGIDILIQAITILNKDGIDNFRVDIVGEGPLLNYCQDTVKRNHIQNCIVWGLVPQEKLDSLYRQADCLICPSRLEGFGIVLLEAGANDLAIIANDIPVFREIYSDAEVLYFKQNDPVDLARRVSDLINEPNLVPILRERARIKVENYKWQNVVKDYMSIYLNMTARNKG